MIEEPFKISGEYWLDRTFDSKIFKSITLYVPQGTMDKYKATEGWKDFALIKELIPIVYKDEGEIIFKRTREHETTE